MLLMINITSDYSTLSHPNDEKYYTSDCATLNCPNDEKYYMHGYGTLDRYMRSMFWVLNLRPTNVKILINI